MKRFLGRGFVAATKGQSKRERGEDKNHNPVVWERKQ